MIFCSLLIYPLNSIYRYAAERCLYRLLEQLEDDDVLLTFEKTINDREAALRLKPKVVGLGLAAARKGEWVCFVDGDIEFRDGFVKRLKEFLRQNEGRGTGDERPTLVVTKIWERGNNLLADENRIKDIWQWSRCCDFEWDFYFGTGFIIANKPFLAYIDEWQILTNKSQFYPEETALVTLAHKYRDKWRLVWLPDELHFVGWKVREGEEKAVAVHIGNTELERWLKTATEVKDDAD